MKKSTPFTIFFSIIYIGLGIILFATPAIAQHTNGQTVRGIIKDQASNAVITNAAIELLNHSPRIAIQTNEKGYFVLENVPTGHQRFRIVAEGYYELIYPELIVGGKETILSIGLVEEVSESPFVVVEAKRKKNKNDVRRFQSDHIEAVDELNVVSTHKFNVQEVNKYVGGLNDPARTVTNFPGLFNIDDTQNYIVSRGNSPYGIRWQIEGVPIDNPHHFSTLSNTGGVFPLLNTNLLDNSDFINGAMPAHYGNAYAGVFDVNLRKGNNEKFEFLGQINLYGAEAVVEGPFKKGGASFVVGYRYSIFSLLNLIGLEIGTNAVPEYQDLNFKINIPTKNAGEFAIFGVGGLSNISFLDTQRDTNDLFAERNINLYIRSNTAIAGISHQKSINQKTYIKTALAYNLRDYHSSRDTIIQSNTTPYYKVDETMHKISLNSTLQSKFNARALLRAGIYGNAEFWNIDNRSLQTGRVQEYFNGILLSGGGFAEFRYKFSYRFQAVVGVHGRYWSFNNKSWALEPRISLNWFLHKRHRISFGYGWHSKTQPLAILFRVQHNNNTTQLINPDLGATRSHHAVLSYDLYLAKYWGLKLNAYTQFNTGIPVTSNPSSFSLINYGAYALFPNRPNLVTEGISLNYGLELAIDKFFSRGYYGKIGATYFRSLYQGSDLEWRSTAFDVFYIAQLIGGKEFKIGKEKLNTFYFDIRYNGHGGQPFTPILLNASRLAGTEVLDEKNAFSQRLGLYNRLDLRLGLRFNHRNKNISHHLYVEVLNVTNTKNDLAMQYSPESQAIGRTKQFGLIPIVFYQIKF
jgi:hypothetical protein